MQCQAVLQKLVERLAELQKSELTPSEAEPILVKQFMSSEASGEDVCSDGEVKPVLIVRPLPQRSQALTDLFDRLGDRIVHTKSRRAKNMYLPRRIGEPSRQEIPSEAFPSWALSTKKLI